MRVPLARRLAGPTAIIAMVGVVGWVGGPALARGASGPWLWLVVAAMALAVGGGVYLAVTSMAQRALAPLESLARVTREAALRPRDHIAVFRRLKTENEGIDSQVAEVIDGVTLLLRRIEQRQQQQTAWLGSLIHDVRTPIAAAANALALIGEGAHAQSGTERGLVDRLGTELRDLAVHVQSVLDAVRLERDDVVLEFEPVDLGAVLAGVVEQSNPTDGVDVGWSGSGEVLADRLLLERAIANLLSNALRYARSRVHLTASPGLVRIEDDGPGLPAPLEVLATPFRSESLLIDGVDLPGGAAGMGLFVARRVFELHQGKLVVERSDEGGTALLAYVGSAAGKQRAR